MFQGEFARVQEEEAFCDRVVVLQDRETALLGCRPAVNLGLLAAAPAVDIEAATVDGAMTAEGWNAKYPEVFKEGLGRCSKIRVSLELKEGVRPVHLRARPVAEPFRDAVNKELDRLLANGTIAAVETSQRASPIVVARKANGKIRVCADFSTGLNDALESVSHPIPDMEQIMTRFAGNRVFTQLDLSDAYLQLDLGDASRPLTTITTHRGLFQYNRLVFGLETAPAIFQRAMDRALVGLEGTLVYLDDILVMGRDQGEHDRRLDKVLSRLQQWGFRLGLPKCLFSSREIKYLGMIVNEQGIRADPEKIAAIQHLRRPANVSEVRSLLGLVN